jgi:hypothetical protein
MRRALINVLAVIGGLAVLASTFDFVVRRTGYDDVTGVVRGPGANHVAGIPVFLDRGQGDIQRFVTDAEGRFHLPVERREIRRAMWLICVPGGVPMVGHREDNQIGPTTYEFTRQPAGQLGHVRPYGWAGPIPRECAADSTWIWRYPQGSGRSPGEASYTEPDWTLYGKR